MRTAAAQRVYEFMTAKPVAWQANACIRREGAEYPIQLMSRTLGVSRSGFYARRSRPLSNRDLADQALTRRIAAIHEASKRTYGAPRIHAELAEDGVSVGRKRVERLMKAKGLRGVSRRKFVVTTERDPRVRPAADLVDRNFYADAPNLLWPHGECAHSPAGL